MLSFLHNIFCQKKVPSTNFMKYRCVLQKRDICRMRHRNLTLIHRFSRILRKTGEYKTKSKEIDNPRKDTHIQNTGKLSRVMFYMEQQQQQKPCSFMEKLIMLVVVIVAIAVVLCKVGPQILVANWNSNVRRTTYHLIIIRHAYVMKWQC